MLLELSAAHWLYALVTLVVIVTMLFRRGVVLPTIVGTFLVAWVYKGSVVGGFMAIFNANMVAARELFSIFLIITLMVALLNSLKDLGADQRMIIPIQKVMVNGHIAYFVLMIVTYVISLFFWPTPAVPLICALLVPAAMRAGLPAMGAAMIVAISGQGMALSSDYIMQIAPMLTATSGGMDTVQVADKAMVLSVITGVTAVAVAYAMMYKSIAKPNSGEAQNAVDLLNAMTADEDSVEAEVSAASEVAIGHRKKIWGKVFAILVPLSMLAVMIFMFSSKIGNSEAGTFAGGDGAAFIGGVAAVLLILASVAFGRIHALDKIGDHITDGFVFAFRAMGPVIPIAGFFFLGSSDFTGSILSLGEEGAKPAFLFDLVQSAQAAIPENAFFSAFGILLVGIITGLDGSGFSGLPLVGALSGAMSNSAGIDPGTLAAIGQMGSVWTGGGTLIAWSSLVAVAGFCGVSVLELARKNFIPVMTGLVVATLAAILFM